MPNSGTGLNNFGMDVDVLLAQFDASGNLLSERTFVGISSPRAIDIADDGSTYVTGFEFPGQARVMRS